MMNKNQYKMNNYISNQTKKIQYPQNQIINNIHKQPNNSLRKNMTPNVNLNNRNNMNNMNNMTQNRNQNINNGNDELGRAILIIRQEYKKKDDRIRELERKVIELTNKLNSLLGNKTNDISVPEGNEDNNMPGNIRPFTANMSDKNYGSNQIRDNRIGRDIRGYSIGYINTDNKNNQRSNSYMQSISNNNINYNSDSEKRINQRFTGYDNLSHSNDHSLLTYNGGGSQTSSKADVKNYLKEVKSRIEPRKFKEFIRNIKLLTAKNKTAFNREIIVESIRKIFGDENNDLFIKFENIIGVKK